MNKIRLSFIINHEDIMMSQQYFEKHYKEKLDYFSEQEDGAIKVAHITTDCGIMCDFDIDVAFENKNNFTIRHLLSVVLDTFSDDCFKLLSIDTVDELIG